MGSSSECQDCKGEKPIILRLRWGVKETPSWPVNTVTPKPCMSSPQFWLDSWASQLLTAPLLLLDHIKGKDLLSVSWLMCACLAITTYPYKIWTHPFWVWSVISPNIQTKLRSVWGWSCSLKDKHYKVNIFIFKFWFWDRVLCYLKLTIKQLQVLNSWFSSLWCLGARSTATCYHTWPPLFYLHICKDLFIFMHIVILSVCLSVCHMHVLPVEAKTFWKSVLNHWAISLGPYGYLKR